MSGTPTPRSYSQTIGEMLDIFLSRTGLRALKVGSPLLSVFEAAAQSDLRSSQSVFELLASSTLDNASGQALDLHAADEGMTRRNAAVSSGKVTVGDSRYVKRETKLYLGKPAPILGSTTLYVVDASKFGTSGALYLGRGTTRAEGPIPFTSVTNLGSYYSITLASGVTKYHNLGDSVVLAQGGDRTISAGTIVQTPQGLSSTSTQFSVLYSVTIPDGEVSQGGVRVIAKSAGSSGNVPKGAISGFSSAPFSGATVTNPVPFVNGTDAEQDDSLRERIKAVRQSRSKGTALALKTAAIGVVAPDENKRVSSASVAAERGVTTLYIDDSTGYEESCTQVPVETLTESALGGETFFRLQGMPVSRANLKTTLPIPFRIPVGSQLAFRGLGGLTTTHTFSAGAFKDPNNVDAHELAAEINSNPALGWSARTADSATSVAVYSKGETDDSVEAEGVEGESANVYLGFSGGEAQTLKLYKNDRLLSKDGRWAEVLSSPPSTWSATTSGETLVAEVDSTSPTTYTFTDADFALNTSYETLATSNPLASWVSVFNAKIPGVTASVKQGRLSVRSNRGPSSSASVKITGGTLVTKGFFPIVTSVGATNDYSLNRSTGQVALQSPLEAGDRLTAGSEWVRAFLQSGEIVSLDIDTPATLWWSIDGAAKKVETTHTTSGGVTITYDATPKQMDINLNSPGALSNVAPGDVIVLLDANLPPANQGAWRVASVDSTGASVKVDYNRTFTFSSGTRSGNLATVTLPYYHGFSAGDTIAVASNDPNYPAGSYLVVNATETSATYDDSGSGVAGFGGFGLVSGTPTVGTSYLNSSKGVAFVRTSGALQRVRVPAGSNYTASAIADSIASTLTGATVFTWRTNRVRVRTDLFGSGGDVALIAADAEGQKLGFTVGRASNTETNLAAQQSRPVGTPLFRRTTLTAGGSDTYLPLDLDTAYHANEGYLFGHTANDWHTPAIRKNNPKTNIFLPAKSFTRDYSFTSATRSGATVTANIGSHVFLTGEYVNVTSDDPNYSSGTYAITAATPTSIVYDDSLSNSNAWAGLVSKATPQHSAVDLRGSFGAANSVGDTLLALKAYEVGPEDSLVVVLDKDETAKRFDVPMFRRVRPVEGNYSAVSRFRDLDNGVAPVTLASAFGTGFDWSDFAVYSRARTVTHDGAGKEILWRYYRYGQEGESARLRYGYPDSAEQDVSVLVDNTTSAKTDINVTLASGTALEAPLIRPSTKVGLMADGAGKLVYILGLKVSSITRAGTTVTATLTGPAGMTSANLAGQLIYFNSTVNPGDFPTGVKAITGSTGMNITWTESGAATTTPNAGEISADTGGISSLNATGIVVNNLLHVGDGVSFDSPSDPVSDGIGSFSGSAFENLTARLTLIEPSGLWFEATFSNSPDRYFSAGSASIAQWRSVGNSEEISFYPLASVKNTVTAIVTSVNALSSAANSTCPVSATEIGAGTVSLATWDEFKGATVANYVFSDHNYYHDLVDGVNWIRGATYDGSDYQFTFKKAVSFTLDYFGNSLWDSEELRLAPITARSAATYLGSAGPGGLHANAEVSAGAANMQFSSLVLGSGGGVQVQGGTANSASAAIVGSAKITSSYNPLITIPTSDAKGFVGGGWVELENAARSRVTPLSTANKLDSITSDGWFNFNSSDAPVWTSTESRENLTFNFTKQGKYTAIYVNSAWGKSFDTQGSETGWAYITPAVYSTASATRSGASATVALATADSDGTGFAVGDKLVVTSTDENYPSGTFTVTAVSATVGGYQSITYIDGGEGTTAGTVSTVTAADSVSLGNQGWFRVLREHTPDAYGTIWIENANMVEETAKATIKLIQRGSIVPGCEVTIGTDSFKPGNAKAWTVTEIDTSNPHRFRVGGTPVAHTHSTYLTAAQVARIRVTGPTPQKLVRKILSISPNQTNGAFTDIKLDHSEGIDGINSNYGTVCRASDKFDFPIELAEGKSGYCYSTGLIGEVNRVIYGDEQDTATYPGVVAAGATVNVSGPVVKRIKVSLSVRAKNSTAQGGVAARVKSVVAAFVNSTGVGTSIPVSQLVAAAQGVVGVSSVVVTSPIYSVSRDLISVQPYEKPLVLDPESDILVNFVGT